jgi:hypothetical protein
MCKELIIRPSLSPPTYHCCTSVKKPWQIRYSMKKKKDSKGENALPSLTLMQPRKVNLTILLASLYKCVSNH